METPVRRRSTIKGSITRIESWLNANEHTELNLFHFEARLESLKSAYSSYCEIQQEIEDSTPDQECDRDNIEAQYFDVSARLSSRMSDSQ